MVLRRLHFTAACTLVGAAAGVLFSAQRAHAQSTSTSTRTLGLIVGGSISGATMSGDVQVENESGIRTDRSYGAGAGIALGWGFSKWFSLYAALDRAAIDVSGQSFCNLCDPLPGSSPQRISHKRYVLWNREIIGQFNIPITTTSFVPYARVGYTYRMLSAASSDEVTLTGAGLTAGLGVEYFLSRRIALDAGLQGTHGPFTTRHRGKEKTTISQTSEQLSENNSARVNVGVKLYPRFRR